jgi:hypothetical protein
MPFVVNQIISETELLQILRFWTLSTVLSLFKNTVLFMFHLLAVYLSNVGALTSRNPMGLHGL